LGYVDLTKKHDIYNYIYGSTHFFIFKYSSLYILLKLIHRTKYLFPYNQTQTPCQTLVWSPHKYKIHYNVFHKNCYRSTVTPTLMLMKKKVSSISIGVKVIVLQCPMSLPFFNDMVAHLGLWRYHTRPSQ